MSFANETQKHEAIRNCSEPLAQPQYVETAIQMDLTGEDIEVMTEAKVVQYDFKRVRLGKCSISFVKSFEL